MAGRHRGVTQSAPRRFPTGVVAACAALAVLVGVGGWALLGAGAGCDRVPLNVSASPDIAPVLTEIANRFNDSKPKIGNRCAEVRVSADSPAEVANSLISTQRTGPIPQVWIPDSSIWVDQVRAASSAKNAKKELVPADNKSLATSPTVIAMPLPVATQIGAGSGRVGWGRLLSELTGEHPLKVGFLDPSFNTSGVAALLAVGDIVGKEPDARARQTEIIKKLDSGDAVARTTDDAFAKLPKSSDSSEIQSAVAAIPTTEQAVWKYDSGNPSVPVVSMYPVEGALRLDYPYVVTLDRADAKQQKVADRFLKELQGGDARKDLQKNGFRAPDGTAGDALNAQTGADPEIPKASPKPSAQAVTTAINAWRMLTLANRMLALIDISGSMSEPVPGTGKSRMEVTISAASQGLGLLSGDSEAGLWAFSTKVDGNKDYKELVSLGPLDAQVNSPLGQITRRGALAEALGRLAAKPGGATGLYDSILAAYRTVKATYQPDKVNSVLVFTDGKNDDPGSISLDGLLTELKKEFDPAHPIPVYIIAFGPQSDVVSARSIAAVTTGGAYQANTASDISRVFLDAVGQRACRPHC